MCKLNKGLFQKKKKYRGGWREIFLRPPSPYIHLFFSDPPYIFYYGQLWVWHIVCGQTCDGLYHFMFYLVIFIQVHSLGVSLDLSVLVNLDTILLKCIDSCFKLCTFYLPIWLLEQCNYIHYFCYFTSGRVHTFFVIWYGLLPSPFEQCNFITLLTSTKLCSIF